VRVLIGCEESGEVRRAFRARGHDAWSCDLIPAADGSEHHFQEDVVSVAYLEGPWDLGIFHPPCTYLSRSGWHWVNKPDCATLPLKGEPRRRAAIEAANLFRSLLDAPIPRVAVENPRPIKHVGLPPPTQAIQPWQFWHGPAGDGEVKATCLWLRNLPKLVPTTPNETGRHPACWLMSPGPNRARDRSRTYPGIAAAFAEQWG
jgi:hypothetical protein